MAYLPLGRNRQLRLVGPLLVDSTAAVSRFIFVHGFSSQLARNKTRSRVQFRIKRTFKQSKVQNFQLYFSTYGLCVWI